MSDAPPNDEFENETEALGLDPLSEAEEAESAEDGQEDGDIGAEPAEPETPPAPKPAGPAARLVVSNDEPKPESGKAANAAIFPAVVRYIGRLQREQDCTFHWRSPCVAVSETEVPAGKSKYRRDRAVIRFDRKTGTVEADAGFEPTDKEAEDIGAEWKGDRLPGSRPFSGRGVPDELAGVPRDDLFIFRNLKGDTVMVQHRIEEEDGKRYEPWSFWDDGKWRKMEPEGPLPLFGAEQLKDHSTVFLHEGAKAARAVQRLVNAKSPAEKAALAAHPWGKELSCAAHLGWIGGAFAAHRTDWGALAKAGVQRVYIVGDCDSAGLRAVPEISRRLSAPTVLRIEFPDNFGVGFDLADPFPDQLYRQEGGRMVYTGPSFRSLLKPATWATRKLKTEGKGRPAIVLRREMAEQWFYSIEGKLFRHREKPEWCWTADDLNDHCADFSDAADTAKLLRGQGGARKVDGLAYLPSTKQAARERGEVFRHRGGMRVNTWRETDIVAVPGSIKPFLEFMRHLIEDDADREQVLRWTATLAGRPEVRMLYGLLLFSRTQGVGKSLFMSQVLAPLVGEHNAGEVDISTVVGGDFNSWILNRRLVLFEEVYQGGSFAAANKLKKYVTEPTITVNEKYQRPYVIDNAAHFVAASNSPHALKLGAKDRRWFVPRLREERYTKEQAAAFIAWLKAGGLSHILHWAETFKGDYVRHGEAAPDSALKDMMVEDEKTPALRAIERLGNEVLDGNRAKAFPNSILLLTAQSSVPPGTRVFESPADLRQVLIDMGFEPFGTFVERQIKVHRELQSGVVSPALAEMLRATDDPEERRKLIRDAVDKQDGATANKAYF